MAKRKLLGRIAGYPRISGCALQSLNHIIILLNLIQAELQKQKELIKIKQNKNHK